MYISINFNFTLWRNLWETGQANDAVIVTQGLLVKTNFVSSEGGGYFFLKWQFYYVFERFTPKKKNQNSSYLEDGDESSAQQARGQFDE